MSKHLAIDRPCPGTPVRRYDGWFEVSGWAAASEPITDIRVRADDGPWYRAYYCLPRPDVEAAHPKLTSSGRSGFQGFAQGPADATRIEVQATYGTPSKTFAKAADIASDVREIQVADTAAHVCPWCGSTNTRYEESVRRGPFRMITCGHCDFGFAEPLPAAHALGAIYETEYWDHAPLGPDALAPSKDTGLVCDFMKRFGNDGKRVFEMGCGQGSLLYGLHHKGMQVQGQDLSSNSARALQDKFRIDIWREPLTRFPHDTKFDCIVSRHVLEHSLTPADDVRWMRDHLAPGGIIVMLMPNRRSLAAELLGSTWEWFVPPIHLGYLAPRTLQQSEEVAGLRLKLLTTREGDGASLIPTLRAFLDYERGHLTAWQLARCEEVLQTAPDGLETLITNGGGPAGHGQEMIAVMAAN
ncbi:MAG: methyltransferase domain-containing protein [Planctomycetota bacterium]